MGCNGWLVPLVLLGAVHINLTRSDVKLLLARLPTLPLRAHLVKVRGVQTASPFGVWCILERCWKGDGISPERLYSSDIP